MFNLSDLFKNKEKKMTKIEAIIIENISGKAVKELLNQELLGLIDISILNNYKITIEEIEDSLEPIKIKRGKIKKC